MCGRFVIAQPKLITQKYHLGSSFTPKTSFNITPRSTILTLVSDQYKPAQSIWGIKLQSGKTMINRRIESLKHHVPAQVSPCIIPASGYYEWHHQSKTPYYFTSSISPLITFAGISDRDGHSAIVTRQAPEPLCSIHTRMPLILDDSQVLTWLNRFTPQLTSPELKYYPVSTKVNSPANDDQSLIDPT